MNLDFVKNLTLSEIQLLLEEIPAESDTESVYLFKLDPQKFVEKLPRKTIKKIKAIIHKIEQGYPLEYAVGKTFFYGEKFFIKEGVLIPRPETEFLVETVIDFAKENPEEDIMEVGTGSGAAIITLTKKILNQENSDRNESTGKLIGIELSKKAYDNTVENLKLHGMLSKIEVINADFFKISRDRIPTIVFSNPPYIATHEAVLSKYEDRLALFAGARGTEFYEKLFKKLKRGKILIVEVSPRAAQILKEKIKKPKFRASLIKVVKDFDERERVFVYWLWE